MLRRNFLNSLLLTPLAGLAAKVWPVRESRTVWQTTNPNAEIPPHCGVNKEVAPVPDVLRSSDKLDLAGAIDAHPYDITEKIYGRRTGLNNGCFSYTPINSYRCIDGEFVLVDNYFRIDGVLYRQTTAVPPVTRRIV